MRKRSSPASLRNREPILAVLASRLPGRGLVLEIASGSGEHAVHFSRALPDLEWQPTDIDPVSLDSIISWRAEVALPNLHAPLALDVTQWPWPVTRADAMFCANMIHIAPWQATEALFRGARHVLPGGGALITYGPYRFEGAFTAPSNQAFDQSLRQRDPSWGVRDVVDLSRLASENELVHEETVELPANNHLLVFRRSST
jgi:Protein of unknown function (DUF938)